MSLRFRLTPSASPHITAPVLDESQQAVLDHESGPLLVLAGPGTGKTTTLVELVADRIHRGVSADRVLVLTFSRKAAQEIGARIERRIGGVGSVAARTFHSFCFGLVNAYQPGEPLRLVSTPEQVVRISELLAGHRENATVAWPEELTEATRTRGFTHELSDFLSRAATVGARPDAIRGLVDQGRRRLWGSVAEFMDEYEEVFALANEADYSSLVTLAAALVADPDTGPEIRAMFDLIVVDEYQDTDPAQVRLLQLLTASGTPFVAVGDPDQSIYAFRGADVRGIDRFAEDFSQPGRPAETLALGRTRRFGSTLLSASRTVISRLGEPAGRVDHRRLSTACDEPGRLDVRTFTSVTAEAESIAQLVRRVHLDEGLAWEDIAVLTRTGKDALGRIQRALVSAGVPTVVATGDAPLAESPAVRSLAQAARVVVDLASGRTVPDRDARDLLYGPLGGLHAGEIRRYVRHLRFQTSRDGGRPQPSDELVVAALMGLDLKVPEPNDARTRDIARRVATLSGLLQRTAALVRRRATAEHVLWHLWIGTGWPQRLRSSAESTGEDARAAHRDLDAICALFERAAKDAESGSRRGIEVFLDELAAQDLPGDASADPVSRGGAVQLMTAHRAKGLEWPLVVIAGVQEGAWPDVRARGTLLATEELGTDGAQDPTTIAEIQREERRLFYVAMTRATRRLVVTAVESGGEDGEQPSRFLTELDTFARAEARGAHSHGEWRRGPFGRPERALSLRGSVAALRRLAERSDSAYVRAQAAQRLAGLVDVVAEAHPEHWWGTRDWSVAERALTGAEQPVDLSGSAVELLNTCSARWFYERKAKASQATTTAQGFGLVLHVLAEMTVHDERIDREALDAHLDTVWDRLPYESEWIRAREREEARAALNRYVNWHEMERGRTPVAAEVTFEVIVPVGSDTVRLKGFMDRVEIDVEGRVHVVDFKTGKNPPEPKTIAENGQLGVYQVAVMHGAIEGRDTAGGAELVQLRKEAGAKRPNDPKVQAQAGPAEDVEFFAFEQLRKAAATVRSERFFAVLGDHCQFCAFKSSCPARSEGADILGGDS